MHTIVLRSRRSTKVAFSFFSAAQVEPGRSSPHPALCPIMEDGDGAFVPFRRRLQVLTYVQYFLVEYRSHSVTAKVFPFAFVRKTSRGRR
jgi:hypothetical protein